MSVFPENSSQPNLPKILNPLEYSIQLSRWLDTRKALFTLQMLLQKSRPEGRYLHMLQLSREGFD